MGGDRSFQGSVGETLLGREHFLVRDVAEQNCLYCHTEDLTEHTGDEVCQYRGHHERSDDARDLMAVYLVGQKEVAQEGGDQGHKYLIQETRGSAYKLY